MDFPVPSYEPIKMAFTLAGAFAAWGFHGRGHMIFLHNWLGSAGISEARATGITLLIGMGLGVFVAIGVTDPQNPQQAFAAGASWSAFTWKRQ